VKKKISIKKLRKKVKDFFIKNPHAILNYKQLSAKIGYKSEKCKKIIIPLLEELVETKFLKKIGRGKYTLNFKEGVIEGIITINQHGIGTVVDEETQTEVIVYPKYLHKALPNDRVLVRLFAIKKTGIYEGSVIKILERSKKPILGIIQKIGSAYFLITDSKHYPYDILIPEEYINNNMINQKALVEVIEFTKYNRYPIGRIVEILGKVGDHNTEMEAILAKFNFPRFFPSSVIEEANSLPNEIPKEEYSKRLDLRDRVTFTIDPIDAKDFDDAISFHKINDDTFEIGVHIADVSFYVKENTELDKEAYKRGNSIYLVDRTIPMLPEKLSNDICSLKPNEDRLCFSVIFYIDSKFKILKHKIAKTIIRSKRRFNYDEVQEIIEKKQGDFVNEILFLNEFAKYLRKRRIEDGALVFGSSEIKIILDEYGKPIKINFIEQKQSHNLIEELMLLANKKVTEDFLILKKRYKKLPFIFRIHDKPPEKKLKEFLKIAKQFGYKILIKNKKEFVNSLNNLLEKIKDKPEKYILEEMAIRSMAKAIYSPVNIGHFGLAFENYTHFTSPIRRYPDLIVHRILNELIINKNYSLNYDNLAEKCKHLSKMEQYAVEAERLSIKYKLLEFLQDKIGQKVKGIITSLTEWGIYVQLLDTKAEGMISLRDLDDDLYIFDEKKMLIFGKNYKKKFKIGDYLIVEITRINLQKLHLDLKLIKKLGTTKF